MKLFLLCSLAFALPLMAQSQPKRLALLIGIDYYAAPDIPQLEGAVNDVNRVETTLKQVYGYTPEMIMTLLNEQATFANFLAAWENLIKQADPQTHILFYFAGYGSTVADRSKDEPDHLDETLIFHDSRTGLTPDLSDDHLNMMLQQLAAKKAHVTLIIDAGNAAGMGKGESRWIAGDNNRKRNKLSSDLEGRDWDPSPFENLVIIAAAKEGQPAREIMSMGHKQGAFTAALCDVLARGEVMSYQRLFLSLDTLDAGQKPLIQGNIHETVFSCQQALRPLAWTVWEIGKTLILGGPILPYMGEGAELRIFDPEIYTQSKGNPKMGKALVRIIKSQGLKATAKIIGDQSVTVHKGDLAVLVRPSGESLTLHVKFELSGPSAMSSHRATAIRQEALKHNLASELIRFDEPGPSMKLLQNQRGQLCLIDEEGKQLVTYSDSDDDESFMVVSNLIQHARKRALLALKGEGGGELEDNRSLQVRVVRAAKRDADCENLTWQPGGTNQLQRLVYCLNWNVEVTVREDVYEELLVGGVYMDADGSMVGFPRDGSQVRLKAGQTHVFTFPKFRTQAANGNMDEILIFGTTVNQPVDWGLLTQQVDVRSNDEAKSGLARTLSRFLIPAKKGENNHWENADVWTKTQVSILVEPNITGSKR